MLALAFLLLILVGTAALLGRPGLYTGTRLTPLQALFTATSAVCVTGLTVVDTATWFTPLGQGVLLLLIQFGGLGIITFTTLLLAALGDRLSFRHEAIVRSSTGTAVHVDSRHLVRDVVRFTLRAEAAGAAALWLLWGPELGWVDAAWPALFHAVSAFCNAGFSVFPDNLAGFQRSPLTLGVIAVLVVTGGLGFFTLRELGERRRGERARLSLHSTLALTVTVLLLLGGAALLTGLEWRGTLAGLPPLDRLANGAFMSVTARTAGFNTVDYAAASDGANFGTILLMFIGGSPGSTAGGIKTTTFAVVALLAWSRLRGQATVDVRWRSIPQAVVAQAAGIAAIAFGLVTLAVLALTVTEGGRGHFLALMFEAASAFNTVGLSTGLTPRLSGPGLALLVGLMYVGRVGVLTLAVVLSRRREQRASALTYAREDVAVG